jgi:hypothetical protein
MVYTIWYIPIASWYTPSKSGIYHKATFQTNQTADRRAAPRPGATPGVPEPYTPVRPGRPVGELEG